MAKTGRPTDYKPEYGEQILELMASGLSLVAAAAEINVHRQRIYEWVNKHPEFADIVNLAKAKRTLKLERDLLQAEGGPQVTSRIFALKNAMPDEWREKQEIEHQGQIKTGSSIDVSKLSKEDRDALKAILLRAEGESK